jgi:glutaredoxin
MKPQLTLYSRKDCCLCDEMKSVIAEVAAKIPLELEVIDVDQSDELREKFGNEVPVLFVDARKGFKYRVTAKELEKRLGRGALEKIWSAARRGAWGWRAF